MCGRFYIDPDDMSDEELIALLNREKDRASNAGRRFESPWAKYVLEIASR